MSEENQNNDSSSQPPYAPAEETVIYEPLSAMDAIAGVITDPSETYEAVNASPRKHYWFYGIILYLIVFLVSTFLFYSDEELSNKMLTTEMAIVEETFEQNIKDGKMTRQDADNALELTKKIFFIRGYLLAVFYPFLLLFLLSIVYLVGLKIMKANFDYINLLNAIGLASVALAIGAIVSTVVSILRGSLSPVGLNLILSRDMIGNYLYTLLGGMDFFTIWFYLLVAIGISKIANIKAKHSYMLVFGIWLFYILIMSYFQSKGPAVF